MPITRRSLLGGAAVLGSRLLLDRGAFAAEPLSGASSEGPLAEFRYEQVEVRGDRQRAQLRNVIEVLIGLAPDSLLLPFRAMSGRPAPGVSLGGWYEWKPDYNYHHDDAGLAPAATFGQWTSAMARVAAGAHFGGAAGLPDMAARATELHAGMAEAIGPEFFSKTRFPGYTLDKLVCGLMDGHRLLGDGTAFEVLGRVRQAAEPSLPGHAIERDVQWKVGADLSWMWDENYTLPENLYLCSALGAGDGCRRMAQAYLLDSSFFTPLARGENALGDRHAYSHVNALCSAMQAFLTGGSTMHLRAAVNGFRFLEGQSFATGGWGPDEQLRTPGYDQVAKSLTSSHNGFETPCGSYAHMKLTRYLLRVTRDGRYGDSMERVLHNTVLGALPLEPDGRSFYSSDYNVVGKRIYSEHRWPCCSGTLPQVVADYGINSYLSGQDGSVWVVLYQPSELRWSTATGEAALEQTGSYPEAEQVTMRVRVARPTPFTLHLRIPAWAGTGAVLRVNGRPEALAVTRGFAAVRRSWRNGDVVTLDLPMPLRLEPLPADGAARHPETVALMRGPVVLFPLREPTDGALPLRFTETALLGAEKTAPAEWTAASARGPRRFVPFPDVGERTYSTYVRLL